jgi:hypothetical protein
MTAVNDYIKHMQKCNNHCLKHETCLRYDKNVNDDLMENRNCMYYFETKTNDTFEYLKLY